MKFNLSKNSDGIAIIEAIISFALLSVGGVYFFQAIGLSNNISTFTRHRWKAQIISESVGLSISSLSNQDLYKLLKDEEDSGSANGPGTFYTQATQPWLTSWNLHDPEVQSIQFKVDLYSLTDTDYSLPSTITAVPEEYILDEYHKKITVELVYLSSSKSSKIEDRKRLIVWDKWLSGK